MRVEPHEHGVEPGPASLVFAAVAMPGAAFVLAEMGLCLSTGSGADWPYMARLVGLIGLSELGVLIGVGFILARLTPRSVAVPVSMGLAIFTGLFLSGLLMLGNGLPPVFRLAAHGRAVLLGAALAVALPAALARMAALAMTPRRAGEERLLVILAGPTFLPPALLLAWEVAWRAGIRGSEPLGLVVLLLAASTAMVAGRLLGRRAGARVTMAAFGGVPLLALARRWPSSPWDARRSRSCARRAPTGRPTSS